MTEQFTAWAVKESKGQFQLWSYAPRPLGPRDVEINITHCGICGTDVAQIDGGWGPLASKFPLVPGHEIVGHVTKIGSEVSRFKIGDRVGVGAQCQTCHECDNCNEHLEAYCFKGVTTYNGTYPDGKLSYGGYAENVRVDERFTFKIPENLTSEEAAPLLCAGITVYSPLKYYGAGPNKKVGIVGIGGLGHLGLKFARALGAEVYAISTSSSKEKEAASLGAHHFINTKDKESLAKHQYSLDLIVCTVNGENVDWNSYLSLLRRDGIFTLVGAPEGDIKLNGFGLLFARRKFAGSLIGSPNEIEEMLQVASKNSIGATVQVWPIEKVNDAIEDFRKGNPRYRNVLLLK